MKKSIAGASKAMRVTVYEKLKIPMRYPSTIKHPPAFRVPHLK